MESNKPCGSEQILESDASRPSFVDLSEDSLSCILSFLSPRDISFCACVCRRLSEFSKEERKVWLPMCERRWGSFTQLTKWGNGNVSYRLLYGILYRWENLLGFWRGVGIGGWGSLALFDWAPDCIIGHKVVPAASDTYQVRKIPFLWMGLSEDGQMVSLLDPSFRALGKLDEGSFEFRRLAGVSFSKLMNAKVASPLFPTGKPGTCSIPDIARETSSDKDLVLADVHFVGNHHVVIEEILQQCTSAVNDLAEAATVASFAFSHSLAELDKSPHSSGSETVNYGGSPPGNIEFEMYHFLANKVSSAGFERAARRQRKRSKERAWSQGRGMFESEHFVKVTHSCPTKGRPLQGLWKGFFDSKGLDFVLISYDDQGGIVCRKVHDLAGMPKCGSVFWTSKSNSRVDLPLSRVEEALYNSRTRICPMPSIQKEEEIRGASFGYCEEVVGVLCISSCDFQSVVSNKREGRIWQYSNGNFGFGYLHTNSIIDLRVLCPSGSLLDVVK